MTRHPRSLTRLCKTGPRDKTLNKTLRIYKGWAWRTSLPIAQIMCFIAMFLPEAIRFAPSFSGEPSGSLFRLDFRSEMARFWDVDWTDRSGELESPE